jgi:hypothetical protein
MPRVTRQHPTPRPWALLLAVSLMVLGAITWEVWPWTAEMFFGSTRPTGAAIPSPPKTEEEVRVRLFFPRDSKGDLVEAERRIPHRALFPDRVRAVLAELTTAPGPENRSPLPAGVEVRQVFLDTFGILYLDFDRKIQALARGDGPPTGLATSSIVLTLATNFSEVKRVQFLSEGEELTLLTGGVDLRHPLQPRFPGEDVQPLGTQPAGAP